ncbi:hypothetical protein SKAU_G00161970 [Synaphobranchus kaupii]|uniref:Uncharacterized protein n=1 Tax=Synaphobranchus kaupii TaxID=118154 RepID=A0A9Q1IZZ7_SYNKA|nr:hypothetical protein SKAU_G00161970 [Synaphobranchus kaupii]
MCKVGTESAGSTSRSVVLSCPSTGRRVAGRSESGPCGAPERISMSAQMFVRFEDIQKRPGSRLRSALDWPALPPAPSLPTAPGISRRSGNRNTICVSILALLPFQPWQPCTKAKVHLRGPCKRTQHLAKRHWDPKSCDLAQGQESQTKRIRADPPRAY